MPKRALLSAAPSLLGLASSLGAERSTEMLVATAASRSSQERAAGKHGGSALGMHGASVAGTLNATVAGTVEVSVAGASESTGAVAASEAAGEANGLFINDDDEDEEVGGKSESAEETQALGADAADGKGGTGEGEEGGKKGEEGGGKSGGYHSRHPLRQIKSGCKLEYVTAEQRRACEVCLEELIDKGCVAARCDCLSAIRNSRSLFDGAVEYMLYHKSELTAIERNTVLLNWYEYSRLIKRYNPKEKRCFILPVRRYTPPEAKGDKRESSLENNGEETDGDRGNDVSGETPNRKKRRAPAPPKGIPLEEQAPPICIHALSAILDAQKARWETIRHHYDNGTIISLKHGGVGNYNRRAGSIATNGVYFSMKSFFRELQGGEHDSGGFVTGLPDYVKSKRKLYEMFCTHVGWQAQLRKDGTYEITPLPGVPNATRMCPNWSTFRRIWAEEFPDVKIRPNKRTPSVRGGTRPRTTPRTAPKSAVRVGVRQKDFYLKKNKVVYSSMRSFFGELQAGEHDSGGFVTGLPDHVNSKRKLYEMYCAQVGWQARLRGGGAYEVEPLPGVPNATRMCPPWSTFRRVWADEFPDVKLWPNKRTPSAQGGTKN